MRSGILPAGQSGGNCVARVKTPIGNKLWWSQAIGMMILAASVLLSIRILDRQMVSADSADARRIQRWAAAKMRGSTKKLAWRRQQPRSQLLQGSPAGRRAPADGPGARATGAKEGGGVCPGYSSTGPNGSSGLSLVSVAPWCPVVDCGTPTNSLAHMGMRLRGATPAGGVRADTSR